MGRWGGKISAHNADFSCGQLSYKGLYLGRDKPFALRYAHTCLCHCVSEPCSLVMSQISFAVAHDLLITCFSKSSLSSVQRVQHVLHEGYSIDSTHTEPCIQAQSWATDFR